MNLMAFFMTLEALSITHKSATLVQRVFERAEALAETQGKTVGELTLQQVHSCVAAAELEWAEFIAMRQGRDVNAAVRAVQARHAGALL